MQIRLLFITSHHFYRPTLDALARLKLDCHTQVVAYDCFSHIPQLYLDHQEGYDAVFVSGVSALRVIELNVANITKPLAAYQVDSDGLHRDILRFAVENQSLDFHRVAMDFLLPFGDRYSVADFLAIDDIQTVFTGNQNWIADESVRTLGAEQLILNRIISLWEHRAIDCVICMYSGNVPKLQELGIPCRCPFLSDSSLHQLIRDVLVKIELRRMHDNHPAIVQIFPVCTTLLSDEQMQELDQQVRRYIQANLIECVQQCTASCCTLITSMQVVRFLTDEFRSCRLSTMLQETLSFPATVGYGIGTTVSHAMNNVQIASREARILNHPFVMDTNGNLIGPLNSETSTVITNDARLKLGEVARMTGLSAMTIRKIMTIVYNRGTDKITTQELASGMNTTIRNANRIMKNLQLGGFATPVYTQASHSRGRPVQVYMLDFGDFEQ